MSKYLMTSVAAFAVLVAFTGCSRSTDMFDQGAIDERDRQEQERIDEQRETIVNQNYAAAFERAFGKVGANVDWGFGRQPSNTRALTRSVGTYKDFRGHIEPTNLEFPDNCDTDVFTPNLENVLSYEGFLTANPNWIKTEINGYAEVYIDKVQAIKMTGGTEQQRAKLYVKAGTYDFSDVSFEVGKLVDVYLLAGATLTLNNTAASTAKFDIYIAPGAELIANGVDGLVAEAGGIYNHGTITCTSFAVKYTGFLYNVGEVTTGSISTEGQNTRIVNDATINCASVTLNAGAVQNNAEWTVTGTTLVCSENSGWVNNGKWTTRDYSYIGGSENVINNCYLWVTNDFEMNIDSAEGAFKIDGGGGVLTKNFYGGRCTTVPEYLSVSGPFKIVMGQKAVFKVENIAQLEGGRDDMSDDYNKGIYGPTSGEYAVFQAKNIVRVASIANTWGAVTYGGNLYVSAETHFAQGNDGREGYNYIFTEDGFTLNNIYATGDANFSSGKPNINISETPCSPGFQGGDPLYRVIAEDLSAAEEGDFDFNDVVFDVVKAESGKTTLKLICAGGVLPLRVMGQEVHGLFGDTTSELEKHPMYNTGAGPDKDPVIFEVDGTYTTPAQIKNIKIEVYKNDQWMELRAQTGEPACKILVDDSFVPVRERRNIADENQRFTDYVQGQFADDFWWK